MADNLAVEKSSRFEAVAIEIFVETFSNFPETLRKSGFP